MGRIVGIDLGTTYSAVCHLAEGKPSILPKGRERIIPSVVGFTPEGGLLVGTPAKNQLALYPENTVKSIKRRMGTSEKVCLNGREFSPAEISALVLKEMKGIAESQLGECVDRVVITVPAFFSDAARQATKEAGELAGFTVERIINEPTAAALAYGMNTVDDNQMVAVFDLGGGTFDVSIIELNQGVIEVRASHGDTRLGGDDFDALLLEKLAAHCQDAHGVDPRLDLKAMARLCRAAEAAKIQLSFNPYAKVSEEYLLEKDGKPLHLELEISRHEFEDLIRPLLERTLSCLDQSLQDAGIKASDLNRILMVGGSTRIPLVWEMVARHTGIEPLAGINPDEAVALGAGVQAAIIDGEPIDSVLVDVTPHSLGLAVAEIAFGSLIEDCFSPIIHRNTTLPCTQANEYRTLLPDQTIIELKIYQGESPVASENTLLGEFRFEDLQPEKPGRPAFITVSFDLDINGILHVSATDRGSRKVKQTTVHAAHTRLNLLDQSASKKYLDGIWGAEELTLPADHADLIQARENDDPILAKARFMLREEPSFSLELLDLLRRVDRARDEGRREAEEELLDQVTGMLYELEDQEGQLENEIEVEPVS